jgi:hypothetical protein
MKKIISLSLIVILITGLLVRCEKKGDPPALPPAESMNIDFSNFTAGKKSVFVTGSTAAAENANWTVAATVAGVWNSILLINLAVPVASFQKAVVNSPTYVDKKTWQWKYSVSVVGATYNARLVGTIRSSDVLWDMYVSKDGAGNFAEFKWYTGTTALDGKSGTWTINAGPADQNPLIQIDWTKPGSTVASVKYTYVKTSQSFTGSYIEYGLTTGTLNAYYNVHYYEPVKLKFVDVNIEWSTTVHNGHIKALDFFQDSNWHCWDENGNDIDCPAR